MMRHFVRLAGFVLVASVTLSAQVAPPVGGTTENVAVESTQKGLYGALHFVIVKTIDGVEHVINFTKDLFVRGGKGAGVDALQGLKEGSTVVVHYTMAGTDEVAQGINHAGEQGLKRTEGVLERVDRKSQRVTVRFANGTTETLQLTERAASEVSSNVGTAATDGMKVIVYFTDAEGHRIAHFFKRVP
jgi:hypothetical protein